MARRILFYIIITILLFSCSSTNNQENNITATAPVDFKKLDTLIPFSGYWLSEEYFNNIKKYKSPKKAQDNSEFIFIPNRTLKPAMLVMDFHEGDPELTILKNGTKYQMWALHDDGISESSNELSIFNSNDIQIISPTKIKIGDKSFVKINGITTNENRFKILEEILFQGQYTNASGNSIEFKNNGEVIGLDSFHYYQPNEDYYDEGMQVDQVSLGKAEKDLDWFGFKFKNDTLELYKLKCNAFDSTSHNCGEVELGQLIYKLWRKE
jgi:hypothetical protein